MPVNIVFRRRWQRYLTVLVVAAAVALSGYWILRTENGGSTRVVLSGRTPIGRYAPSFQLPSLAGNQVSYHQLSGRLLVINFWASWCPYCRAETSALIAASKYYGQHIVIVGIDVDEATPAVARFAQQAGIPYPVLLDPTGQVAARYDVQALPTTVFVSPRGRVVRVFVGSFVSQRQLDSLIQHLLVLYH